MSTRYFRKPSNITTSPHAYEPLENRGLPMKGRRLSGLDYNNEALPYAGVMTTLFEYLKNKHPNDASRIIKVDEVTPMCSPYTMEYLEL
ncbi:hypothetical protein Tco_0673008 [Tanacetum coccineum]